jgi:hypothetical protein
MDLQIERLTQRACHDLIKEAANVTEAAPP